MKVIVCLGLLGLSLAGFRGDMKRVPHSIPHHPHHHHAIQHGHGHGHGHEHGNSNSENSEELFSLVGALQGGIATAIQDTADTVQDDLTGTADTVSNDLQGTADTICNDAEGTLCNDAQGTADTISSDLQGTADTLGPIINATGTDIAYAIQHLDTTAIIQDIDEGVALAGTALKTAGDVMNIVDAGLEIAGLAFVDLQGIIQNDIQGTIDTIQSDIQGTVETLTNDFHNTVDTISDAIQSVQPAEVSQAVNDIASGVGTGLKLANSALGDANDGLGIADAVIP